MSIVSISCNTMLIEVKNKRNEKGEILEHEIGDKMLYYNKRF